MNIFGGGISSINGKNGYTCGEKKAISKRIIEGSLKAAASQKEHSNTVFNLTQGLGNALDSLRSLKIGNSTVKELRQYLQWVEEVDAILLNNNFSAEIKQQLESKGVFITSVLSKLRQEIRAKVDTMIVTTEAILRRGNSTEGSESTNGKMSRDEMSTIWTSSQLQDNLVAEAQNVTVNQKEQSSSEFVKMIVEAVDMLRLTDQNFLELPPKAKLSEFSRRLVDVIARYRPILTSEYDAKSARDKNPFFGSKLNLFAVFLESLLKTIRPQIYSLIAKDFHKRHKELGKPIKIIWKTMTGVPGSGKGTYVGTTREFAKVLDKIKKNDLTVLYSLDPDILDRILSATAQVHMPAGTGGPFKRGVNEENIDVRFRDTRPIGEALKDFFDNRIYLSWDVIYLLVFSALMLNEEGAACNTMFVGDVYPFNKLQEEAVMGFIHAIKKEFADNAAADKIEIQRVDEVVMRTSPENIARLQKASPATRVKAIKATREIVDRVLKGTQVTSMFEEEINNPAAVQENIDIFKKQIEPLTRRSLGGTGVSIDSINTAVSKELSSIIDGFDEDQKGLVLILVDELILSGLGGIETRIKKGETRADNSIRVFIDKGMGAALSSLENVFSKNDFTVIHNDGINPLSMIVPKADQSGFQGIIMAYEAAVKDTPDAGLDELVRVMEDILRVAKEVVIPAVEQ